MGGDCRQMAAGEGSSYTCFWLCWERRSSLISMPMAQHSCEAAPLSFSWPRPSLHPSLYFSVIRCLLVPTSTLFFSNTFVGMYFYCKLEVQVHWGKSDVNIWISKKWLLLMLATSVVTETLVRGKQRLIVEDHSRFFLLFFCLPARFNNNKQFLNVDPELNQKAESRMLATAVQRRPRRLGMQPFCGVSV